MLIITLVTVTVLLGLFLYWGVKESEKEKARQEERKAAARREQLALSHYKEANGFADAADVRNGNHRAWLALNRDENALRVLTYRSGEEVMIVSDKTVPLNSIMELTFRQDSREISYTRTVTTPVAVQKKKSAIGRGVVGLAVGGVPGLLLGAASAVTPSSKIVEHKQEIKDTKMVDGPPTLVFGLRDAEIPLMKLEFQERSLAEEWLYRIKAKLDAPLA